MLTFHRAALVLTLTTALAPPSLLFAQSPQTRTIRVNGHAMRLRTAGLERRTAGQPVLILEAGANSPLGAWQPVFADLARLAPVVAYDRSGFGQSEFDGAPPTLPHVAQTLHALLANAKIPPPYVLVSHSWGAEYARGFASLYPTEIAGLVYVEPSDFERTEDEMTRERPASGAPAASMSPPIPTEPPAAKAEMAQIVAYSKNGFADIKAMQPPPTVPTAVIVATKIPDGFPSAAEWALTKRLQIKHQAEWATASPHGLLLVSTESGHYVMGDAPDLIIQAVTHVLKAIARP